VQQKTKKKVEARLDIAHLQQIARVTGIPLVLHGGSGIKREYVLEAIKNGITKINIGTEIRQAYERGLGESSNIKEAQKETKEKVKEVVSSYYEIEGSARILSEKL